MGGFAMKSPANREGSALILTLLLLALMLTLVLYYVSLVRLETQVSGYVSSQNITRAELDRALGEALAELENAHLIRAATGRTTLTPDTLTALVSQGGGGAVSGLITEAELTTLGWPMPAEIRNQIESASWGLGPETNGLQRASAWAIVPLSGLLDPEGLPSDWNTEDLNFVKGVSDKRVYFSAAEFIEANIEAFPDLIPVFMPGAYSRDRGWYDFENRLWQTTTEVGPADNRQILSMDPLKWSEAEVNALFAERYGGRDASMASAFMDFIEGKTLPRNPNGITAVPVPMFNEVSASITVTNLGDTISIAYTLEIEIWYPFQGNLNSNTYRVVGSPSLKSVLDPDGLIPVTIEENREFICPEGDVTSAFKVVKLIEFTKIYPASPDPVIDVVWDLGGLEIKQVGEDTPVDRLPEGLTLTILSPKEAASIEVVDPVLNHNINLWKEVDGHSLSEVNQVAKQVKEDDSENLTDGWIRWTPAGQPGEGEEREWEEGWIGFLPLDEPFKSVDLFAEEGQWWLQHTRRQPNWEPGKWQRSKVNPNSRYMESLSAVFNGLPLSKWPGENTTDLLTLEMAVALANGLAYEMGEDNGANQRGGWTDALEPALIGGNEPVDRHVAESIIRQSLERLDVGYQLYGLILCSEVRTADGNVRSRQRQVYTIWLDPYPTNEGRIAMMKISWTSLP
jgi:hypothetical protein